MLISLNWLKQYVKLDDNLSVEELENALTMIGQEVEKIEIKGKNLDNVITAKIVSYEMCENSDHLTKCMVDTGSEVLQVVCGAKNHKLGDVVVLAQVGAKLSEDFVIKKGKIRGVESNGMLCSEVELNIGNDNSGIIILPNDTKLGIPLKEYLGLDDIVFELEITPNRPDCNSYIGIARELATFYNKQLYYPENKVMEEFENPTNIVIEDNISDRYISRIIKGVKVGNSPKWLVDRLHANGIRSINNLVDISNYIMLETNQPNHIYDLNKLESNEIKIRLAKDKEKITTLDEKELELTNNDIVVTNNNKVIALAGVMGDITTKVTEETKDILLEVAHFNNLYVRKTSRKYNIISESSYRFERWVDKEKQKEVLDRLSSLIVSICGGRCSVISQSYPNKYEKLTTTLNLDRMERFIGKKIELETILNIFKNLEVSVNQENENTLLLTAPTHRKDLVNEFDYFEEIIRMYGFDNIENVLPKLPTTSDRNINNISTISKLKQYANEASLMEVINYSFISSEAFDKIKYENKDNLVHILNPITEDFKILRPTLMFSLLKNASDNIRKNLNDIRIFEVSSVFTLGSITDKIDDNKVYIKNRPVNEERVLGILLSGRIEKNIWSTKKKYDFYDLKGIVEYIFNKLGFNRYRLIESINIAMHPGKSADVYVGKELIATFGEVHPDVLENMDIEVETYYAEIYYERIQKYINTKFTYQSVSQYPSVARDIAIQVSESEKVGDILISIQKVDNRIIKNVNLFDVYSGENIEKGTKSIGISILIQDDNKTLTDQDITEIMNKITNKLIKEYNAIIR